MPTYLTPGVYVEEVPSANKPIEGVGTAVAAFVGLAPGGPVNKPMRISNWTQFAKIFGDPAEPGERPVHGGRLPGALRLRLLPERRSALLDRPRRRRATARQRRGPRCPPRPTTGVEALRAIALEGVTDPVTVEISRGRRRQREARSRATPPTRSSSPPGPSARSTPASRCKKGRTNIATKVNAASKLIKIEETGARAARDAARAGQLHAVGAVRRRSRSVDADDFEGDVATPQGHGRPRGDRRGHDAGACPTS